MAAKLIFCRPDGEEHPLPNVMSTFSRSTDLSSTFARSKNEIAKRLIRWSLRKSSPIGFREDINLIYQGLSNCSKYTLRRYKHMIAQGAVEQVLRRVCINAFEIQKENGIGQYRDERAEFFAKLHNHLYMFEDGYREDAHDEAIETYNQASYGLEEAKSRHSSALKRLSDATKEYETKVHLVALDHDAPAEFKQSRNVEIYKLQCAVEKEQKWVDDMRAYLEIRNEMYVSSGIVCAESLRHIELCL
jgi:hypothetical protein